MAVHRSGPGGLALRLMVQGNESPCQENGDVVPHSRGEIAVRTGKQSSNENENNKGTSRMKKSAVPGLVNG